MPLDLAKSENRFLRVVPLTVFQEGGLFRVGFLVRKKEGNSAETAMLRKLRLVQSIIVGSPSIVEVGGGNGKKRRKKKRLLQELAARRAAVNDHSRSSSSSSSSSLSELHTEVSGDEDLRHGGADADDGAPALDFSQIGDGVLEGLSASEKTLLRQLVEEKGGGRGDSSSSTAQTGVKPRALTCHLHLERPTCLLDTRCAWCLRQLVIAKSIPRHINFFGK